MGVKPHQRMAVVVWVLLLQPLSGPAFLMGLFTSSSGCINLLTPFLRRLRLPLRPLDSGEKAPEDEFDPIPVLLSKTPNQGKARPGPTRSAPPTNRLGTPSLMSRSPSLADSPG